MQIYNEKIYDLLKSNTFEYPIEIKEDADASNHIEGLSEYVVTKKEDCIELLLRGEKNRVIRTTNYNDFSSRSHTIF